MFGLLAAFQHSAEMRESKDEMLIGEIVRAMARQGFPSIQFRAGNDRQYVRFKTVTDPVLHTVTVVLDRKTGSGALSAAILGSKATLKITAEIMNRVADPDDLIAMYKTDFANIFKMPVMGGIKLNHELNSVFATTTKVIEIDHYVNKGDAGVEKMVAMLSGTIGELKEKLEPYKR
ncbi:MAG: hypothetical protein EP330_13015 [Deltaproteobacteria bacterium]|nr:MAG: hypothetical protein EP330_13015 [Deltaproteobacteria bacterium]